MYAMKAMKQYQQVSIEAQVSDANPHRLIQLLMQGGLERLAQARGAMEREQIPEKGILIGKAIGIIGGLREALDSERGGELAGNLDRLYEYIRSSGRGQYQQRYQPARRSQRPVVGSEVRLGRYFALKEM